MQPEAGGDRSESEDRAMTIFKRHMGRQAAAVGVAVAMLVLGLATPAYAAVTHHHVRDADHRLRSAARSRSSERTSNARRPITTSHFGATNGTGEVIDSDTQIEATIPASVGDSTSANRRRDQQRPVPPHQRSRSRRGRRPPVPGVPTFSPSSGIVGSTVTISGTFTTAADRGAFQHLQPRRPDERNRGRRHGRRSGGGDDRSHPRLHGGRASDQCDQLHRDTGAGSHDHLVHAHLRTHRDVGEDHGDELQRDGQRGELHHDRGDLQ